MGYLRFDCGGDCYGLVMLPTANKSSARGETLRALLKRIGGQVKSWKVNLQQGLAALSGPTGFGLLRYNRG